MTDYEKVEIYMYDITVFLVMSCTITKKEPNVYYYKIIDKRETVNKHSFGTESHSYYWVIQNENDKKDKIVVRVKYEYYLTIDIGTRYKIMTYEDDYESRKRQLRNSFEDEFFM